MILRPAVALLLIAAACTQAPEPPRPVRTPTGPPPAGTIRLGYPSPPPTLDPAAPGGGSAATRDLLRPVLPALFRVGPDLRPVPELAAAWPSGADVTVDPFTVRLRLRRATWSDGRPITSSDVRFSWERLREGPTGARYRFLEDVEVVSARTLRLRFDRPVRRWWALFSLEDMVLPAHAYGEAWASGPTVSGGPYRFAGGTPGLSVRLERNERWWGGTAQAAAIEVLFVPDDETRLQLLRRGELDAVFAEGEANYGYRAGRLGLEAASGPLDGSGGASGAWGPTWWEVDADLERLGDRAALARAAALAVDTSLATEILEDSGRVAEGLPWRFPAEAWDGPWRRLGGDVEAARRVLREAGYRERDGVLRDQGGTRVELLLAYPASSSAAGALARLVHFQLRPLGVRTELVAVEPERFEREWVPGHLADLYVVLRRGSDAPDPAAYHPSSALARGVPSAVEHLDRAASAVDPERLSAGPVTGLGRGAWAEAQEAMAASGEVLPVARVRTWIVGRDGLRGPHATGTSAGPLWNAEDWSI